ncbi:MAG: hypothetical protein A2Y60_00315 [Chloroflexi bacterium RBG_13_54_9]|nr:MAG: hypothetical protein A2Y60_00315 [Chloroflexi bacterium RBG_13_54_9]
MILFCDEDIGTKVPDALKLVGLRTMSMSQRGWLSRPDVEWLTLAGQRGWLVFSCNKKMLKIPEERRAIIQNKVGIVFLTNGEEHLPRVLWLLLVKWPWLEHIDKTQARPFVFFLTPYGRVRPQSLLSL